MALLNPVPPPYDIQDWLTKPFPERVKMVCQSWALQGYGTPWPIYIVYILKIVFYVWVWSFFCSSATLALSFPIFQFCTLEHQRTQQRDGRTK